MVYIIAEVGSVHDGSFGNATKLIELAKSCGADAVKFQTHISAAETLHDAPAPSYFKGEPRYEYFERTGFTLEQWQALKQHCAEVEIAFLSSPFSAEAVDLLEEIGLSQYKIPSGEVTNLLMLEKIAMTGKPVILSSGMSSWEELDQAVETIREHTNQLTILQCTSAYPCPYEQVGLNIMLEIQQRYNAPVGLSDHTATTYACIAAVALGATVIEKHLTFSRAMYGSDAPHSLESQEFADMVAGIRAVEVMLHNPINKDAMADNLLTMKETFEKSIVSLQDIPAGTLLRSDMLGIKKPGTGIPAAHIARVIGRRASRSIPKDTLVQEDDLNA